MNEQLELIRQSRDYNIIMGKVEEEFYYEIDKNGLDELHEIYRNNNVDVENGPISNDDNCSEGSNDNNDFDFTRKCY